MRTKSKIQSLMIVVLAWLVALALLYITITKLRILFSQ